MADDHEEVEQTLHIAREVSIYKIPLRQAADGYRSGEWLVSDKLFAGRLRVVARGETIDIRVEDASSGELFALCAVPYGKRAVSVEPATDSSRYFVVRVEDPTTKRHAFLGLGFDQRADAFDFTEALVWHEQHVERERASRALSGSGASSSGQQLPQGSVAAREVEHLHSLAGDLSLKEGQTIKVNIKKPAATGSGLGLLSGAAAAKPGLPVVMMLLSPPPPPPLASHHGPSAQPHPTQPALSALHVPPPPPPPQSAPGGSHGVDGVTASPAVVVATGLPPDLNPGAGQRQPSAASGSQVTTGQENWATFD